jgi:protein tyrosine phosphatase (PTP) superfamily phosphohydrolase (DUF442 family)
MKHETNSSKAGAASSKLPESMTSVRQESTRSAVRSNSHFKIAAILQWCEHGVSEAMLYNWEAKYGGMDATEAKRLKQPDDGTRG